MSIFINTFTGSAKEFTRLRSLVAAALLIALHTVMSFFLSIQVTPSLRISVSFLANVVIGYLFGPIMGFVCGGLGDIIQFIIKPVGPFFPGWTLNAALAGFIYGCFFYGKSPKTVQLKVSQEDSSSKNPGKVMRVLDITSIVAVCVSIISWFGLPFLQIIDKTTKEVTFKGTAFDAVIKLFTQGSFDSASVLAIILMICSILALVGIIVKITPVTTALQVIAGFIAILSVYTDKKTTTPLTGFIVIVLMAFVYGVFQLVKLMRRHTIDVGFMIRCIIALTVDTLIVNVFLGTEWCHIMYGKGFAFYFTTRFVKNMVQLPINIILVYYVLGFMKNIKNKVFNGV